jgi:hypothetical protein
MAVHKEYIRQRLIRVAVFASSERLAPLLSKDPDMDVPRRIATLLNKVPRLDLLSLIGVASSRLYSIISKVEDAQIEPKPKDPAATYSITRTAGPSVRKKVGQRPNPSAKPQNVAKILDMIVLYLALLPDPIVKDDESAEAAIATALKLTLPSNSRLIRQAVDLGYANGLLDIFERSAPKYKQIMLRKELTLRRVNELKKRYPKIAKISTSKPVR